MRNIAHVVGDNKQNSGQHLHNTWTATLRWLNGPGATLCLDNVNIEGAIGLGATSHELFQQRGAVGTPAEVNTLAASAARFGLMPATTSSHPVTSNQASTSVVESKTNKLRLGGSS